MDAMEEEEDDDDDKNGPSNVKQTKSKPLSSTATTSHPMTPFITELIDIAWTFIVDETRHMVDSRLLQDDDDDDDMVHDNKTALVQIDAIVSCWNAVLVLVSLCAEETLVGELLERKKIW
jgi:hypothetical protein